MSRSTATRSIGSLMLTGGMLTACSSNALVAAPSVATTAKHIAPAHAQGKVALTIKIPSVTANTSSGRRIAASAGGSTRHPAYVSSATESAEITISDGSSTVLSEAIGLTPASNSACSTQTSSGTSYTQCTITLPLTAGSYTGTMALYSGPVVASAPTGDVLSEKQSIALTVTAGTLNTVAITLDGVPASIVVAPTSSSSITGTQNAGLTVKYTAQPLLVEAEDAAGEVILGPGAPTFSVSATAKYSVTQPQTSAPNLITLEAVSGGIGTLTVTAVPSDASVSCSTSGVVCTASVALSTPVHTLYAAESPSGLVACTSYDDVTWTCGSATSLSGADVLKIAAASDGTLFFLDGNGTIQKLTTSGTLSTITGFTSPQAIAVDSAQQLVVADSADLDVFDYPCCGAGETTVGLLSEPEYLAVDSSDDAIVGSINGATNLFSAASSYVNSTSISGTYSGNATVASNGNIYIGASNLLGEFSYPYTGSPAVSVTLPIGYVRAITMDSNGKLWVSYINCCSNTTYGLYEYSLPLVSGETPSVTKTTPGGGIFAADSSGDIIVPTDTGTLTAYSESGSTAATITSTGIGNATALLYVK